MNGTHLPNATFERRCYDLYKSFRRRGIRPAWIEPRVVNQAMLENQHNLKQQLRSRAHRRHARKHDQLTEQAKEFKLAYDACGRHPTFHSEAKPHELILALRKTTL